MIALILAAMFSNPTPPGHCQFKFCNYDNVLLSMPPQDDCKIELVTNPPPKWVTDKMIEWSQVSPKVSVPYECMGDGK